MPVTKTTKEDILKAVWQVFHQHGYHDASLQRLADAAGLGKAGLLHHFGNKAGLMAAAIDFAISWYERKVLSILTGPGTIQERFGAFMVSHFRLCQMNQGAGCFFANTILETGVGGQFSADLERFHGRWKSSMEKMLTEQFPEAEARERTYRLFADYQGSVILYKLYQDTSHLDRFRERALLSFQLPIYPN